MPDHKRRTRSIIAGLTIAAVGLLSFPAAAQQAGPQCKHATVGDEDFVSLQQQIKQLKNPTFRAFLRIQLITWQPSDAGPARRQAAMEVATQGVTDLCEHQDEVWLPTASWLHEIFVKQIKNFQAPEAPALEICVLKSGPKNGPASDLSAGIKMLSSPETSAAGLKLAKAAILSGQVQASSMLGQLHSVPPAHLPELLGAVLSLEEKQPGALTLMLMPFFSPMFFGESVPPELTTRWMSVALRATRLPAEELAKPFVGGPVNQLLNGIAGPAQRLAPALFPEIASRLRALNKNSNILETRLAAEERIQKATDPLEQLISEANSASDEQLRKQFFSRAARAAKEQGKLTTAVDLATKTAGNGDQIWLNEFLLDIVSLAVKNRSPFDATYAIPHMTRPLIRANAFRLVGEYYAGTKETIRSKQAFTQSAKALESADNSNDKVRMLLMLAEGVLKYEPADAYELFHEAVKGINNLPSPEQSQEKMYYVQLLPIAEDLIRTFRELAAHENQIATNLAAEIKLSELRVSALGGTYSSQEL